MRNTRSAQEIVLGPWSVHSIDVRRQGLTLSCEEGEVLVTCEGDPEDHVLAAGSSLHCEQRGRVVVAGLLPSLVRVAWSVRAYGSANWLRLCRRGRALWDATRGTELRLRP
jgi:Protein of unknown function (DUF2917)